MKKKKKNEKDLQEENLLKIKQELEKKHKLPEGAQENMNRKMQINILVAITVMLYFYFLNVGITNIEQYSFLTNLKGFSMLILTGTIILFELAYKKDDGRYAIFGIESLFLAIMTLFFTYVVVFLSDKFKMILVVCSLLYAIYYTIKSLIIYIKTKREFSKNKSDVKYIVKK